MWPDPFRGRFRRAVASGMNEFAPADVEWMRRAIVLSRRGLGQTLPNPMVGAVIVADGEVVGEGYHEAFGSAHAEIQALRQAGERARGATLYATLEPCAHEGKTPPCTRSIVAAGIRRVVYGVRDPHSEAAGGAIELSRHGVMVTGGVLAEQAAEMNAAFLWWHSKQEPFVALKLAVSLDGKIAAGEGVRTHLSGPEAGLEVMRLRAAHDTVMVGAGTAMADNPLLTVRGIPAPRTPPLRVVLDSDARIEPGSRLVSTMDEGPVLLFVGPDADRDRVVALRDAGVEVVMVDRSVGSGLDIAAVLDLLRERERTAILCEGGGRLAASLLQAERVHRLHWFVCPRLLGSRGVDAIAGHVVDDGRWRLSECSAAGQDVRIVWNHEDLEEIIGGR